MRHSFSWYQTYGIKLPLQSTFQCEKLEMLLSKVRNYKEAGKQEAGTLKKEKERERGQIFFSSSEYRRERVDLRQRLIMTMIITVNASWVYIHLPTIHTT